VTLRSRLREYGRLKGGFIGRAIRLAARVYNLSVRSPLRFVGDPSYRALVWLRLSRARCLHQTTALTGIDRYPGIFASARDYLSEIPELRILSFGCSTGEEVLTLKSYFPQAWIVGAEINPRSLKICRSREPDPRISFGPSDAQWIASRGPYDAIFCLAVLQRTPMRIVNEGIQNIRRLYPFAKFNRQLTLLDSWLKPGGLLAIHHAQYRLIDADIGRNYTPHGGVRDFGPKFDPAGGRLPDDPAGTPSVFVKTADPDPLRTGIEPRAESAAEDSPDT
jgi:hypothetical protein